MSDYLTELHATLDARWRPEDVLDLIVKGAASALPAPLAERASGTQRHRWSSMSSDFARPVDAARVLASVGRATQRPVPQVDPADAAQVHAVAEEVGSRLGWSADEQDHLTREQRAAAGVGLSRRQYNRQWRAVRRLNRKASKLSTEQEKRDLIVIGRSGFASRITADRFHVDPAAAHFVAYWVARKNARRQFSLSGKSNPMDEVARALLDRCEANPGTDWEMVAWARPTPDVLTRLTDQQRGTLLADWVAVMRRCATLMERAWDPTIDRTQMIVRRGQDSSTWNTIAQAYNAARAAWLTCLSTMGAEHLLEAACPGKAMRLMAADLAYWHRSTGSDVDPNTWVWANLPLPWEVLNGDRPCTSIDVTISCRQAGLDPRDSGWLAPKPPGEVVAFTATPELVHGVSIADPVWAQMLRKAGAFSGKHVTADPYARAAVGAGLAGGVVVSDRPERVEGQW